MKNTEKKLKKKKDEKQNESLGIPNCLREEAEAEDERTSVSPLQLLTSPQILLLLLLLFLSFFHQTIAIAISILLPASKFNACF